MVSNFHIVLPYFSICPWIIEFSSQDGTAAPGCEEIDVETEGG